MSDEAAAATRKRSRPKAANSSLPLTSVIIDRSEMRKADRLLAEAAVLKKEIDERKDKLDRVQTQLVGFAAAYAPHGFRHGNVGFQYGGWRTRQTLSKEKLVENGVAPEVIGASYVESEPYLDARFILFDDGSPGPR